MTAVVDTEKCLGCGACVQFCPKQAIALLDGVAVVDATKCNGCGTCVQACFPEAITLAAGQSAPTAGSR